MHILLVHSNDILVRCKDLYILLEDFALTNEASLLCIPGQV